MILNQWYVILESREVKRGALLSVRRMGRDLVLWRDTQGTVSCMSDHCIHRGVALSAGKVKGDCVECPFHSLQYDGQGRVTVIPANGKDAPVPAAFQGEAFVVREAHDYIYLWWGEPREEYAELPFIPGLDDSRLIYGTWRVLCACHREPAGRGASALRSLQYDRCGEPDRRQRSRGAAGWQYPVGMGGQ